MRPAKGSRKIRRFQSDSCFLSGNHKFYLLPQKILVLNPFFLEGLFLFEDPCFPETLCFPELFCFLFPIPDDFFFMVCCRCFIQGRRRILLHAHSRPSLLLQILPLPAPHPHMVHNILAFSAAFVLLFPLYPFPKPDSLNDGEQDKGCHNTASSITDQG